MSVVLVTGATGFVGVPACRALEAAGWEVRALVRDAARAGEHARPYVARGLDDADAVRRAADGADAVVHLASRVHVMRDRVTDALAAYRAVNVEGTRALLEAARAGGVRTFVYISSVKAVGEATDVAWTSRTPAAPVDPYGISKLEAETVVRAFADAHGLRAPILRLPLVYGPGVRANVQRLFALVARGIPLPLGAVRNRRSLVFVGNVTSAIVSALEAPAVRGTYFVSDGQDLSTPDLVRAVAAALGRRALLVPVPESAFRFAGRLGDLVPERFEVPVTTAAVDRLLGSLVVDMREFGVDAAWTPPFDVETGMRETARWFVQAAHNGAA